MKMIVSYANCRIEIPSSTRCGTIPEIHPASLARLIRVANMSVTRLNRIGERGSPIEGLFLFERNV
jgi:hypothetical protein